MYFAVDASPARAEEWRRQASSGASEPYAVLYDHYLSAVGWMLSRAEELLDRAHRLRLVAPSPYPEDLETIQPKRLRSEARHRRVRDLYYRFLEDLGDDREAYRRVAQTVGYSERTVRERIIKRQARPKPRRADAPRPRALGSAFPLRADELSKTASVLWLFVRTVQLCVLHTGAVSRKQPHGASKSLGRF